MSNWLADTAVTLPDALPAGRTGPLAAPLGALGVGSVRGGLAAPSLLAIELADRALRLLEDHQDLFHLYWTSQSTPWHLVVTIGLFAALFLGRQALAARRIVAARRGVPLVIGGWGTRGKSGTERKKTALFSALGAEVVCKTTGCEAMFIHAQAGVKPMELFIYRPYDKATIWEQRDLLELARDLDCHVFLYECMALNPQYVRLIQQGWMRDDVSTLTNAYPDHEDIQGPAGVDLPYVIGEFIPAGGTCFTAEDTMLPILDDIARQKGTALVAVNWRDGALIPKDVLERYPYQVHPMNLALVTRMAEHLGIERDFCWKEVADWIVPDLGVLKVFGPTTHLGRRLEFSNGHSANERYGLGANWARLGLHGYDAAAQPDRWVITVVNNRADRIARSKVFADALTQDLRCHRHFLIGTNLQGLLGFVAKALETRLVNVVLRDPETRAATRETALARFDKEVGDLMYETPTLDHVQRKLEVMLAGLGLAAEEARALAAAEALAEATARSPRRAVEIDPLLPEGTIEARDPDLERALDDVLRGAVAKGLDEERAREVGAWYVRYVRDYHTVTACRAYVEAAFASPPSEAAIDAIELLLRDLLRRLYKRNMLPIWNAQISGDGIVDFIARNLPPGMFVHIHGCQNIKGPGLDWVYRWVNLDAVERACARLAGGRTEQDRLEGLIALGTNNDYGLLDAPRALAAARAARERPQNQGMAFQTQCALAIEHIEAKLRKAEDGVAEQASKGEEGPVARLASAVVERVSTVLEKLMDSQDAKWRRRFADRIKRDLVAGRIGHDRAASELRDLMKRQKGGWLRKGVQAWLRSVRASVGLPERGAAGGTGERE